LSLLDKLILGEKWKTGSSFGTNLAMPSNPLCYDPKTSSENFPQLKKKMGSSVLEHAVKVHSSTNFDIVSTLFGHFSLSSHCHPFVILLQVRKPYTITKQRERWMEEEHNKFLEALKLYGRAWRQIEGIFQVQNEIGSLSLLYTFVLCLTSNSHNRACRHKDGSPDSKPCPEVLHKGAMLTFCSWVVLLS